MFKSVLVSLFMSAALNVSQSNKPLFFAIPCMDMHGYMQECCEVSNEERALCDLHSTDNITYFLSVHGRTVGYVVCNDEADSEVYFKQNYRDYKGESIARSVQLLLAKKS